MENLICIRCASVYEPSKDELYRCPKCSFVVKKEFYNKLINYAKGAAEYGYIYRLTYEQDYERDKTLSKRYKLSAEEIWTFCALAALSGIIGNVAYDVLKGATKKIIDQFKSKGDSGDINEIEDVMNNSDKFDLFIYYLTDYYNGMPNVNPAIRDTIVEEIQADSFSDTMSTLMASLEKPERISQKHQDINKILKETLSQEEITSDVQTPEQSDFDEFWQMFE